MMPATTFTIPTDGLGPNERGGEERGGSNDRRSHARVTTGYAVVAGRTV